MLSQLPDAAGRPPAARLAQTPLRGPNGRAGGAVECKLIKVYEPPRHVSVRPFASHLLAALVQFENG